MNENLAPTEAKGHSKAILVSLGIVVILAGAIGAFAMRDKNRDGGRNEADNGRAITANGRQEADNGKANTEGGNTNPQSGPMAFKDEFSRECPDTKNVAFTSAPLAINDIRYFDPLGKMLDGHVTPTDHAYIYPTDINAADNTYNVLMPADGTVVRVAKLSQQQIGDALSGTKTIQDDHRIVVAHSCRYYSIFIHVHQLSDKLKAAVGALDWNSEKQTSVTLKAGESIGKIGNNPIDWSLLDTSKTLTGFITPANYAAEPWKIHTIDPIGLYTGDLKTQLIAKSLRSVEPYGGKIDYDKAGALVGTWFRTGTNGYSGSNRERYWDGHLSVVPDPIDPASTVVSIGNWDGQAKQLTVKGTVDPATVTTTTGPVKYELVSTSYIDASGKPWNGNMGAAKGLTLSKHGTTLGTIMLEVQAGEKLKVEKFVGKAASDVTGFTAAVQTYER